MLRCRAIEDATKKELVYYKFKVENSKLTKDPLAPSDGAAKDFENEVGLRDLSNISMPASVEIPDLRAIVFEGLDAFEELRCNEKEQDKMRQNLEELKQQRERLQDPDDPDDVQTLWETLGVHPDVAADLAQLLALRGTRRPFIDDGTRV